MESQAHWSTASAGMGFHRDGLVTYSDNPCCFWDGVSQGGVVTLVLIPAVWNGVSQGGISDI